MALHSVLSLGIGVGSASAASHKSVEEGHAPKSQPEGPAAPPSLFDTLLGPDTQDDEVFIEEYAGPVELTIHSLADTMTELEVSCDAEIEDVKNRAAQRLVLLPQHGTGAVLLDMASGKVLPGNGTVKSCQLSHRSRLLLMGKSRLYAPKDVHVSAMLVYARLAEKKFVLAKPQTLRENEDLLLRLDTEECHPHAEIAVRGHLELSANSWGRFGALQDLASGEQSRQAGQTAGCQGSGQGNLHPLEPCATLFDRLASSTGTGHAATRALAEYDPQGPARHSGCGWQSPGAVEEKSNAWSLGGGNKRRSSCKGCHQVQKFEQVPSAFIQEAPAGEPKLKLVIP
ncbi:unnamed protein product [Effrenium voratum]|uniref:Uncharacterized protein n=1 Tax=Effrenium voratum TaxID=2562239 RepID=A0AA36NJM6_9DINO|nr:unnamed protein product [Effrenium voratum]CAJ1406656.1 unnamed protein product [Effrenium voratum]CAJ1425607.1 unnamed protein product [Effrenium voratum]